MKDYENSKNTKFWTHDSRSLWVQWEPWKLNPSKLNPETASVCSYSFVGSTKVKPLNFSNVVYLQFDMFDQLTDETPLCSSTNPDATY